MNEHDLKALEAAMHAFVEAKGWYRPDSARPQTSKNLAISLSIEANEVLELYQWGESAEREALSSELADVLLYLLQIASLNQIDLGRAVLDKLRHNYKREWDR